MPRWLLRLFYALRGKRRVRLHLVSPGEQPRELTVEGVLVGRWSGHYVLFRPRVVESESSTIPTESPSIEIPIERVFFVEVLAAGARW